eukprot:Opistho-1_new@89007
MGPRDDCPPIVESRNGSRELKIGTFRDAEDVGGTVDVVVEEGRDEAPLFGQVPPEQAAAAPAERTGSSASVKAPATLDGEGARASPSGSRPRVGEEIPMRPLVPKSLPPIQRANDSDKH